MNDLSAWTECVDNSQAQLEHQSLRILNLALMAEFGPDAWKLCNHTMVQSLERAQRDLVGLRSGVGIGSEVDPSMAVGESSLT